METYTEDDLKQSGGCLDQFQEEKDEEELSSDEVSQVAVLALSTYMYVHVHGTNVYHT